MAQALERRLELLQMDADGFDKSYIVKELAVKHHVTERTLQYDFSKRGEWQPVIQELDPAISILEAVNRLEHIYRRAARKYVRFNNEFAKVACLKIMISAVNDKLKITNPNFADITLRADEIGLKTRTAEEVTSILDEYDDVITQANERAIQELKEYECSPEEKAVVNKALGFLEKNNVTQNEVSTHE